MDINGKTPHKSLRLAVQTVLLAVLSSVTFAAHSQGLMFKGMETIIDERTSFRVFDRQTYRFKNHIEISFQIQTYFQGERDFKGNIMRIINRMDENTPVISLYYDGASDAHRFRVNAERQDILLSLDIPKDPESKISDWMDVDLTIDMDKDSVELSVDGQKISGAVLDYPDVIRPDITFGKSGYIIDVPSFAIRNLEVSGSRYNYYFPLDEEYGEVVHDSKGHPTGHVSNPLWMAGKHYTWNRIASHESPGLVCAGYDPEKHEVWAFNRDSLLIFNVKDKSSSIRKFKNPCPVNIFVGTSFMNPTTGEIYAYEVQYNNDISPESCTIGKLDPADLTWHEVSSERLDMQMHHHTEFYDDSTSSLYIFGGFGNEKYNGSLYRYDVNGNKWEHCDKLNGDRPCPRYFCAMGYNDYDHKLYIFGGMGNKSGLQVIGREYQYDLYAIDLKSMTSEYKWNINWKTDNCVPARNMVISDSAGFYALCYPESATESELQLYRFEFGSGEYIPLGNTIPIYSDKITTNANLFYDRDLNLMLTIKIESRDDIRCVISVYSINCPPRQFPVIAGESHATDKPAFHLSYLILCMVAAVLFIIATSIYVIRLSRIKQGQSRKETGFQESQAADDKTIDRSVNLPESRHEPKGKASSNILQMFGVFTVTDRNGDDISYLFSEKLKEMLFLIMEYSGDGGISSRRLGSIMWPEYEEENAKNIKGVTLNKLRKLLSRIDGISIKYQDGKYHIETSSPLHCDLFEVQRLIRNYRPGNAENHLLLDILSKGKFLASENDPLLDSLKKKTENAIEPVITEELEYRAKHKDWDKVTVCTDILFQIDPLNEDALEAAIRAYTSLGRSSDARILYNSFISKYKEDYGELYRISFEKLAEESSR